MIAVVSALCEEKGGTIERHVYPLVFTPENLQKFWEKAKEFPTLYGMEIKEVSDFMNLFLGQEGDHLEAKGLFWVVDDFSGVFYISDITEGECNVHYTFFDRVHNGRHNLTKKMLKYIFSRYKFRRVNVSIPLFASKYTRFFVTEIGFKLEGRKRKAAFFKGQWFDIMQYGLLVEEVFPPATASAMEN